MRTPLGGPVATLLMFVPLVAIPLFAVFGTPQISTTGSPATQVEDLKFAVDKDKPSPNNLPPETDLVSEVQVSDGSAAPRNATAQIAASQNAADQNANAQNAAGQNTAPPPSANAVVKNDGDPFADFVRPSDGQARPADASTGNRAAPADSRTPRPPADDAAGAAPPKTALAANDPFSEEGRTARPGRDSAGVNPPNEPSVEHTRSKSGTRLTSAFDSNRGGEPSEDAKGLRAGIARLNELGITDYQWQPGDRDGQFLFRCRLVSRRNPRMMQRFEAEAAEPLQALEKVLAQIDEWRARRAGRDVRTSVGEAPVNATVMAPRDETLPASTIDVSNR